MKGIDTASFVTALPLCAGMAFAQNDPGIPQEPLETGVTEEVRVDLVLLETLVLDGKGRTVPGLTKGDFILTVQGRPVPIDVLDVDCPAGAVDEVRGADRDRGEVRPPPAAPELRRRMVLVFDYYHLPTLRRGDVLAQARAMLAYDKAPGDEVMIVAMANGLRIEQRFTAEVETLVETLRRMEHDTTLYAMDFGSLVTDRSFFENLATLADVLANYDGTKVAILFSQLVSRADDWDLWFESVAARAAAARTVIYPVYTGGLAAGPLGGSPSLARLATQSGGRFTYGTNDLSLGYARAQRDLACRYTVGFYVDADDVKDRRAVGIRVKRGDAHVFSPEIVRRWSAEERRKAKLEAAFSDPEPLDQPLIRAQAFHIRPQSANAWDGLLVVHVPWPVPADGTAVDVAAELTRGHLPVGKFDRQFRLEPPAPGTAAIRPVTIVGETRLAPGSHTLTVVVGKAGGERLHTSRVEFAVPEVPRDRIFLRGPVLARIVRDGVVIRVAGEGSNGNPKAGAPERPPVFGEDDGVEPMLVHGFDRSDTILARWEACHVGRDAPVAKARVERHVVRVSDGAVVHRFPALPLVLASKGKVSCQGGLDDIPSETLGPGSYRLDVSVARDGSDVPVTVARTPIQVD